MKPPIPWGRALVLGILPTVALAACTPLWLLAQMGGPVGFGQAWVIVFAPALLLTLFVVKTRRMAAAILCGLTFSVPLATFCWVLPSLNSDIKDYSQDVRACGVATVVISIVLMVFVTLHRQLKQPP